METPNLLVWKDEYSVNHEGIDGQHRRMIALIDKYYKDYKCGADRHLLLLALKEANEYAETHFREEEIFLRAVHYPLLRDHERLHEEYRTKVRLFVTVIARENALPGEELFNFLKEWWRGHIQTADRRYCEYVKNTFAAAQGEAGEN